MMKALMQRLDKRMERLVMRPPAGEAAQAWKIAIAALLLLSTVARAWVGPYPLVDLFILPILASCVVFRTRGLKVLPLSLLGYHLGTWLRGGLSWNQLLASDLAQLLEWCLLAAFVLITLDRYSKVKLLQQRFYQDLEMARTLQSALIPVDYSFGKLRLRGWIRQSHDVGGDFYYFRPFMQRYTVFCLGDVMGKGISASLLMALVMGFMFEWGKQSPSPGFILRKLNHRLIKLWTGRDVSPFITMIYGVFNEEDGILTYAAAGHQHGLVMRVGKPLEMVQAEGLPLGVMDDTEFEESQLHLSPGDRVAFFTDGISEARAPNGELLGHERIARLLDSLRTAPLPQVLERVDAMVQEYTEGHVADDMALLIAEVL